MKAEREKREGPDLIDRSQFAVYSGTVPAGMDVGSYIAGANAVLEAIDKLKAVDAVPVVRCKDCIHSEPLFQFMPNGTLFCNTHDLPFPADGFCSRGVRKDDEDA